MSIGITIGIFLSILIICIILMVVSFPEVSAFLFIVSAFSFQYQEVSELGPEHVDSSGLLLSVARFIHSNIMPLNDVLKISIIVGIPLIYLILVNFVHIGTIYPLRIFSKLVLLGFYFVVFYYFEKMTLIQSLLAVAVIGVVTIPIRRMLYEKMTGIFRMFIRTNDKSVV
jgi:hypothetical protein